MEKLYLWEKGKTPYFREEYGQEEPNLAPFLLNNGKKNGCVIVCPGGAYCMKGLHEGDPVSRRLNTLGVSAFTLEYRIAPYRYPAVTGDLLRAIRYLRYHADALGIDPEKIAVLGFSAGGHLAVSSLCTFDYGREDGDEIDRVSARPDAAILCYPVVTLGRYTNRPSRDNLIGGLPDEEELERRLSGELAVREDTPPCFLWHTQNDAGVPVYNSLQLYQALCEKNIPSELHVFPFGPHGMGLAEEDKSVSQWVALLGRWLDLMGFVK